MACLDIQSKRVEKEGDLPLNGEIYYFYEKILPREGEVGEEACVSSFRMDSEDQMLSHLKSMKMNEVAHFLIEGAWHYVHMYKEGSLTPPELSISTEEVDKFLKYTISEGSGDPPTYNSTVTFSYKILISQEVIEENETTFLLDKSPNHYLNRDIQKVLKSMKIGDKCWVLVRYQQKNYNCEAWAFLHMQDIVYNYTRLFPRLQDYLYEETYDEIVKRVINPGNGEPPAEYEKWVTIEGRLEDGYQFQRQFEYIFNSKNTSKRYSAAWEVVIPTLKRKEKCWVKAPPGFHIYIDYPVETLWFLLECVELREIRNERPADPKGKCEFCQVLIDDANRLFRSEKIPRAKFIYNDCLKLLTFKNKVFLEFDSELKNQLKFSKARVYANLALCHITDAKMTPGDRIKHFNEAITKCNQALNEYPNHPKALYRKALCLFELNRVLEAEETLRVALRIQPGNSFCLSLMGRVYPEIKKIRDREAMICRKIFKRMAHEEEKELLRCK